MPHTKKPIKGEAPEIDLESVRKMLDTIENNVNSVRQIIFNANYIKNASTLESHKGSSMMVEGVFNGEMMVDKNGKTYAVSPNYASKSKLVPGDILKLTIASDGSFIYKQIGPVERKKIIGQLDTTGNKYYVTVDDKNYQVLSSSVTYFKAEKDDKIAIIVPKNKDSNWAAIENVIERK